MFLATTDYRPFWDTEDELLFLGPWCTRYDRRHEWERLKYRYLPNPWNDRGRLDRDIAYCIGVVDHLIEDLTAYLNATHNVSHGPRYWRILLGFWLHYYVHDLYGRYVYVREALEQFPDIQTVCLAPDSWLTPRDTTECVAQYEQDRFPLQLYSQVLRAAGRALPERSATFACSADVDRMASGTARLRPLAERWIDRGVSWLQPWRQRDIVLSDLNFSIRHVWAIIRATGFRARLLCETLPRSARGERKSWPGRDGLGSLKTRDEFQQVLVHTLSCNFPTVFLEGYARAREACRAGWEPPPRVLVSSVGWVFNEYFKFVAAESVERGSRLLGIQHGGVYGIGKSVAGEVLERSITDRWYAWGWASLTDDPKVGDLPSPQVARIARSAHRGPTDQILYVSTVVLPISIHRMHNCPIGSQFEEYFDWRLKFIGALSKQVADQILIRLYPVDLGWNQAQRIKDAVPGVRLDDMTSGLKDRLKGVRLALFDHSGTSFLEGLASGVPCLLFWNPAHWECRPVVAPYMDSLRHAGILFDDPVMAAHQTVKVYADPETWWESDRVRQAREVFVERFALNRPNWPESWARELRAEAALSRPS